VSGGPWSGAVRPALPRTDRTLATLAPLEEKKKEVAISMGLESVAGTNDNWKALLPRGATNARRTD
jgi:hypothetical protein